MSHTDAEATRLFLSADEEDAEREAAETLDAPFDYQLPAPDPELLDFIPDADANMGLELSQILYADVWAELRKKYPEEVPV